MEFFPAEVDGKPSPIRIEYTIHFQPKTVPADAGTSDAGAPDAAAPDAAAASRRTRHRLLPCAARVVVRGRHPRARHARAARSAPTSRSSAAGAAPDGGDPPAEMVGATDDDGRFEVRRQPRPGRRCA